jgi:hypothetical protein
MPSFPSAFKRDAAGRAKFWAAVDALAKEGKIVRQSYKNEERHARERWLKG